MLRFNGRESISKPFHFELELATENPELPLKDLLGKGGSLTIHDENAEAERSVRGMVTAAKGLEHRMRFSVYRIVPAFSGKRQENAFADSPIRSIFLTVKIC